MTPTPAPAPGERPLVIVTGCSGRIGVRTVKTLAAEHRVVGLDVKAPDEELPMDFVECDLTSDEDVEAKLTEIRTKHGTRIASVIHLAAYYDFSGEPSPLYDELTVEGTRRMVRHLKPSHVEQFVFSSTMLAAEPVEEGERVDEDTPLHRSWEYPRSKVDTERVLQEEAGDIPVVILRIAGAYDDGCHSPPLSQHIARIADKKLESYFFPGDADHGQAFVHLEDVVDVIHRVVALRNELGRHEVFMIGEPEVMSHRDLQERIGELVHGKAWPTIRIPAPLAKAGAAVKDHIPGKDPFIKPWMVDRADDHYPLSIERARRRLGWEPKHRLHESLETMVAGMKKDPAGWRAENDV